MKTVTVVMFLTLLVPSTLTFDRIDLSAFKDEFKKAGLAAGKDGPATVHNLMLAKTGQVLVNTDPFHPAFFLRLDMKGKSDVFTNYRMTEDFATGELKARWSDNQGDWSRKLFVSRTDDIIVMSISGPKGKVDCDIAMEVKHALVKSEMTVENGWLAAHNTYIKGKGGYDNLIRVFPTGGDMSSKDSSLSITGADNILLVMQVKRWKTSLNKEQSEAWAFSPDNPDFRGTYTTNKLPEMKKVLAGLQPDYSKLFTPHAKAHGALYNRVSMDLGGGNDRLLTSEELLARAARGGTMSKALAERLYNACRYLIICSSGDTPPNLQGIWTGTWNPAWSGDYTLDSNIQLEVQSMMNQGQCAARLGRSDVVYEILSRMTTKQYVYPSFMISYWPNLKGFGFDPVGTIPDVLNNALIFGWNNTVDILPALPKEWPKGAISGVLLRGQILVKQLAWDTHW